jgi:hypothetical protein
VTLLGRTIVGLVLLVVTAAVALVAWLLAAVMIHLIRTALYALPPVDAPGPAAARRYLLGFCDGRVCGKCGDRAIRDLREGIGR